APVGAGESGYIATDPLNPDIVYGGDTYGGVHRFDRVTGQSQDITPWPAPSFGQPMPQRRYRFTWTSPIVFDRKDPHILYIGAQRSEEHTSELQSRSDLVCRLLLEKQ